MCEKFTYLDMNLESGNKSYFLLIHFYRDEIIAIKDNRNAKGFDFSGLKSCSKIKSLSFFFIFSNKDEVKIFLNDDYM